MKITCNRLVWLREVAHEKGTAFTVVAEPTKPTEIDQGTADRWRAEGWLEAAGKKAAAGGEGA